MSKIFNMEAAMSFREKSAAITLFCLLAIYGGYAVWALGAARSIPASEEALVAAALGMVAAVVIIHILAAALSWRDAQARADERDRSIGWRAARNGYYTLMSCIWISPVMNLLHPGATGLLNSIVGAIVLAEVVNYGSRFFYYRRGA